MILLPKLSSHNYRFKCFSDHIAFFFVDLAMIDLRSLIWARKRVMTLNFFVIESLPWSYNVVLIFFIPRRRSPVRAPPIQLIDHSKAFCCYLSKAILISWHCCCCFGNEEEKYSKECSFVIRRDHITLIFLSWFWWSS